MPKRISIILLLTVSFAIVALYGATKAMAFCDYCDSPVETCYNGDWMITLKSVDEIMEEDAGTGWYKWWYEVKKIGTTSSSGLNFLAMLIPDCCTGPAIDVDVFHSENSLFKHHFDVAEGEPTVKFGMYNEQASVAKGTPDKKIDWHLITNTNAKTQSTIILKVKRVGVLTFEMAAPGCLPAEYIPVQPTMSYRIGTVDVCFKTNPHGCPTKIYYCDSGASIPRADLKLKDPVTGQHVFIDCNTFDNRPCKICGIQAGSPDCMYISIGGTAYGPICWY